MTTEGWGESLSDKESVELQGKVANPGHFLSKDDATFAEYLKLAGGLTLDPKNARVIISRAKDGSMETVSYRFEPMEQLPTPQPGDIVRLEEEISSYPAPKRLRNGTPASIKSFSSQLDFVQAPRIVSAEEEAELYQVVSDYTREPGVKRLFNQVASYITATKSKVIGVISPTPSENKQIVTAALAAGFSEFMDARVLVIGLDRKSKLLSSLQTRRNGATASTVNGAVNTSLEVFAGVDVAFADHLKDVCQSNLDFYIHAIIQEVRHTYDLILLDLPWYLNKSAPVDAIVAGSQSDSCLVVLDTHEQGSKEISKFKRELERHRISCLGTVSV